MSLRDDFPILNTQVNGAPAVYLDNEATLQMPLPVLDAVTALYRGYNGNVHRSAHSFGRRTEAAMEAARETVRRFLGAAETEKILFTAGTTDAVNALAALYAGQILRPGDEIIVTEMEHHSNFLPWVHACEKTGTVLRIAPMTDAGELDMAAYRALLGEKTRLVAAAWVSNALGTVNDAEAICRAAHEAGAAVLLDAAQAVLHVPVDVQRAGCDYLVFSGHKLGGLTGTGGSGASSRSAAAAEPSRPCAARRRTFPRCPTALSRARRITPGSFPSARRSDISNGRGASASPPLRRSGLQRPRTFWPPRASKFWARPPIAPAP